MRNKLSFLLVLAALAVALAGCTFGNQAEEKNPNDLGKPKTVKSLEEQAPVGQPPADQITTPTNSNQQSMSDNLPQMIIDQKKIYIAVLHTDAGEIDIALNSKETPITANNFVWLAKKNFYNNTVFHRVIKGFMIQGGDPKGDGSGGPGYSFRDEKFSGDYTRGTVAMANAGPDTNGSQFFIMHADYPLPKNYVIFGHVTKGLETVDKIAEAPVKVSPSGEASQPLTPVKITSIDVIEK